MKKEFYSLKDKAFEKIDSFLDICWQLNNFLADNPELSGKEYKAADKITNLLKANNFNIIYPFAGFDTAFKAYYGKNNHSRKIAILAEYDALPEIGHACGHCLSGSISVLSALALCSEYIQDVLDLDIHIIGTPIEETDGAKCQMVKDGLFDSYDMAIMLHLYNYNFAETRLICLDSNLYTFFGSPSHASAAPWNGKNALNGAQLMMHAIDMLRQHLKPDVRIHGVYRNGGIAPNIVPETASIELYTRALDRNYLNEVNKMVDDCARGAAIATQTRYEKEPTSNSYDNLKSNNSGNKLLEECFEELNIEIDPLNDIIFGSSDIGNVSFICPTFQPTLAITSPDIAIHTREFEQAVRSEEALKALKNGARLISLYTLNAFYFEENLINIKSDFKA